MVDNADEAEIEKLIKDEKSLNPIIIEKRDKNKEKGKDVTPPPKPILQPPLFFPKITNGRSTRGSIRSLCHGKRVECEDLSF